jgi:hypothetical protein
VIRIKQLNGKVQSFSSFCEEGGLSLPMSEQSHFLWIVAPTAQVKLLYLPGYRPNSDGRIMIAMAIPIKWGSSNESEQCYEIIDKVRPKLKELNSYSDFMVLQLGEPFSTMYLLIVGSRDGKKERVGFLTLTKSDYIRRISFRLGFNIPAGEHQLPSQF